MTDTTTKTRKPKVAADRLIVSLLGDGSTFKIVKDLGPVSTAEAKRTLKALAKVEPGAYEILYRPAEG